MGESLRSQLRIPLADAPINLAKLRIRVEACFLWCQLRSCIRSANRFPPQRRRVGLQNQRCNLQRREMALKIKATAFTLPELGQTVLAIRRCLYGAN